MNMSETLNESTTSYQVIKNRYDIKKIFSNVKSENDIFITQFRDESRRLHHM
jgi:hypothetical protein